MAVIQEVIRAEENGAISFGDYETKEKKKIGDFELNGDVYSVKTHDQITRIEKNGSLLLECVPGATVHNLDIEEHVTEFQLEGFEDTQVTLELENEEEYRIYIGNEAVGEMKSNLSGKISFSVDVTEGPQKVKVEKRS